MQKFTGETVEIAVEKGLHKLNLTRKDVKINIIEEGKRGIFGFGKKDAEIAIEVIEPQIENKINKASMTENNKKQARSSVIDNPKELVNLTDDQAVTALAVYLTDITRDIGTPSMVSVTRKNDLITFNLETDKKGLLIGKHGKLLNAIQYLSQVYIHRIARNRLSIVVNVGDYREKRELAIQHLTKQTIKKVRQTRQPVFLEPMPAFERKQIHSILAKEPGISTHSEGNEPHRYLVVELKE